MTRGWRCSTAWRSTLVALFSALLSALAHAHAAVAGMGGIGAGLLHPLITPAHVLLLLGLGLWLGQQRPVALRWPMLIFTSAAGLGLMASNWLALPVQWLAALLLLALVVTLLAATATPYAPRVGLPLLGTSGLLIGLDSGADSAASALALVGTLLSTWLSLGLCLANAAFYTSMCPPRRWVQMAIRVLAAWVGAVCVLLLAFALRGNPAQ